MTGLLICTALIAAGFIVAMVAAAKAQRRVRQLEQLSSELARQQALLQSVHDHLPTAMTVVSAMGENFRLVSLNREAARLFGLDPPASVGRILNELPFPGWTAGLWEEAAKQRPTGDDTIHYEQTLDQGRRIFGVTIAPLKRDALPIEQWCVLTEDVSARKQLDSEIAQSRRLRAVGELVGGIAHEFNNLLTPVMLKVGEIQIDRAYDQSLQEDVGVIAKAAQRAADLTRRLLTFGRKAEAGAETVRLETVIAGCFDLLQHTVDRRIRWESAVPPGLPPLHFSASDLNQVMINLLINARDTLLEKLEQPPGSDWTPQISVAVVILPPDAAVFAGRSPGVLVGWQQLTVGDNGAGIAPDVSERVFEPFYSTKGVGKGMGLGLATVWHLVTQAGGRVELDTEPGKGSAFHLLFPVWANEEKPLSRAATPRIEGVPLNILMVEDDPLVSRSVAAVLRREGMMVVALADGAEAKRHLVDHHERYQAMLVDLNLPGASGIDILARARDLGFRGRTMVMSGRLGPEELNALKRLQVDQVLSKPFTPEEFTSALRLCLG